MKSNLLAFFFFILCFLSISSLSLSAQCTETITITSLDEMDNFPGDDFCFIFDGDILIGADSSEWTNLNALSRITEVIGDFEINGMDQIQNLDGLDNLTYVSNYFNLIDLPQLENINALNNLVSVGKNLYLKNLAALGNLEGLNNLETIGKQFVISDLPMLENLDPMESLDSVNGVSFGNLPLLNNMDGLSGITHFSEMLYIVSCPLIEDLNVFTFLPENLGTLFLAYNDALTDISSLQVIRNVSDHMDISGNLLLQNLNDLSNLETVGNLVFCCSAFTSLSGLNSVTSVSGWFGIAGNEFLTSLEDLESIQSVGGRFSITGNTLIEDFSGLENLTTVGEELWIKDNPNLTSLNGLQSVSQIGLELEISNNPNLYDCCIVESLIAGLDGEYFLEDNDPLCNDVTEILLSCDNPAEEISFHPFYDLNENMIFDENEFYLFNQSMVFEPESFYAFSEEDGPINTILNWGDYEVFPDNHAFWEMTTNNNPLAVSVPQDGISDYYLGYRPKLAIDILDSDYVSGLSRCNGFANAWINYANDGTNISNGFVNVKLDPLVELSGSEPPYDYFEDGFYYWNYESLNPSYGDQIHLTLEMPDETFTGESLYTEGFIIGLDENMDTLVSDKFTNYTTLLCSYDPNDKLVEPAGEGSENFTLFEDSLLTYTIRFQNTGNDTAFNIRIEDTLDWNLDITSFDFVAASHPVKTVVKVEDRALVFEFDNIYLPDSNVNELASHGFVKFRIKKRDNLPEFTPIENTGFIYFDFNAAIVTNTVRNTFVSEIPTGLSSVISRENNMKISPNPASNHTMVSFDKMLEKGSEILVVDIQGKLVLEMNEISNKNVQLETSSLHNGIYFISLKEKSGHVISVQKLMIGR